MPTIVDALTAASAALNNAVQNVLAIRDSISAQIDAKAAALIAQANQPVDIGLFVDPINGSDANDGKTVDTAMKTLDALFQAYTTQHAFDVNLLNDITLQNRQQTYGIVTIFGAQRIPGTSQITYVRRTISFTSKAQNLLPNDLTAPSGLFLGGNLRTAYIDFALPDVPSNFVYRSHFTSFFGVTIEVEGATISVSSPQAGALLGGNHMDCFITPTLAAGAAGHVFDGVPAGGNPNVVWQYNSNLKSA